MNDHAKTDPPPNGTIPSTLPDTAKTNRDKIAAVAVQELRIQFQSMQESFESVSHKLDELRGDFADHVAPSEKLDEIALTMGRIEDMVRKALDGVQNMTSRVEFLEAWREEVDPLIRASDRHRASLSPESGVQ